jgi:hypothetical protein
MQSMVLEVLIAFGLAIVAEVGFLIADSFDCRQHQKRENAAESPASKHDPLGLAAR